MLLSVLVFLSKLQQVVFVAVVPVVAIVAVVVVILINLFLDASTHLYKRLCPSFGPSVGP